MKKIISIFTTFVLWTSSVAVFAQIRPTAGVQPGNYTFDFGFITRFLGQSRGIIGMLPAMLMGVAVVVFFFFLIKYLMFGKNDPKEKQKALHGMMYSLIAIFIMVALWGIIAFATDTLGINTNVEVVAPMIPRIPMQ